VISELSRTGKSRNLECLELTANCCSRVLLATWRIQWRLYIHLWRVSRADTLTKTDFARDFLSRHGPRNVGVYRVTGHLTSG
jgi:hypothetical protein